MVLSVVPDDPHDLSFDPEIFFFDQDGFHPGMGRPEFHVVLPFVIFVDSCLIVNEGHHSLAVFLGQRMLFQGTCYPPKMPPLHIK